MMNYILNIFSEDTTHALGWTIIHSLWQGAFIALLMTILNATYSKGNARKRYKISVFSMVLMLAASLVTFMAYLQVPTDATMQEVLHNGTITTASGSAPLRFSLAEFINNNTSIINMIWITGTFVFLARFVLGYVYIRFLKHSATTTSSNHLIESLERISQRIITDKVVAVKESIHVQTPIVIGHFKPLILFPLGLVNQLSIDEVDAIISHELAHISRNDFLINLVLTIIEAIYYYHPAVWWISANIRAERENCCDDIALSSVEKLLYTKTLLKIEEMKPHRTPSLAMPIFKNKHQLLNRIKRIMNIKQSKNDMKEKGFVTVLFTALVLLFATQANSEERMQQKNINTPEVTAIERTYEAEESIEMEVIAGEIENIEIDEKPIANAQLEAISDLLEDQKIEQNHSSYEMKMTGNPSMSIADGKINFLADKMSMNAVKADTTPVSKSKVIIKDSEQDIEVEIENGEVKRMKIDGKVIPESEYDDHLDIIELGNGNHFQMMDIDLDFDLPSGMRIDSIISNSFGMMLDNKDQWKDFGSRNEWLEHLNELEHLEIFENFPEGFGKRMEDVNLEIWADGFPKQLNMDSVFGEIEKLNLDSIIGTINFDFDENFPSNGFQVLGDDMFYKSNNNTVVDEIGNQLNKDGLLMPYKANKIEISGKHLKINGEKMPKALYNKYKDIYQEKTGAPLTKDTKMVFEIEGKKTKRKMKTF